MNITLMKHLGNFGVVTGWNKVLRDGLKIDAGESGIVTIGDKSKQTEGGVVYFYEWEIVLGTKKIEFTSEDGVIYHCGEITRNGRFIEVKNDLNELVCALAVAYEKQAEEIESLRAEIAEKEKQRTIKIL